MKKYLLTAGFILSFLSQGAIAVVASYPSNNIKSVFFYTTYGDGDVVVKGSNMGAEGTPCESGFWIRSSDPGAKTVISAVLSAYHAGRKINVYAENSSEVGPSRWAGSPGGWYCRIDAVGYSE